MMPGQVRRLAQRGGKMPSSKRKSVPGRCSLPSDFAHVTAAQRMLMGAMAGLPMFGQPVSLGQLSNPLAITYGNDPAPSASARASTVAESVVRA